MRFRTVLVAFVALEVMLFVASAATAKRHSGGSAVSVSLFALVLVCLFGLLLLGGRELLQWRRSRVGGGLGHQVTDHG